MTEHTITNADPAEKVGDCAVCGPGVRLRVRQRLVTTYVACRSGDRGRNQGTKGPAPLRQRSGVGFSWSSKWTKYGLTHEEYLIHLDAQRGLCLICAAPMEPPMIDHDHLSGKVRGLLCTFCNAGLGFFRDNADALESAARYVRGYTPTV